MFSFFVQISRNAGCSVENAGPCHSRGEEVPAVFQSAPARASQRERPGCYQAYLPTGAFVFFTFILFWAGGGGELRLAIYHTPLLLSYQMSPSICFVFTCLLLAQKLTTPELVNDICRRDLRDNNNRAWEGGGGVDVTVENLVIGSHRSPSNRGGLCCRTLDCFDVLN